MLSPVLCAIWIIHKDVNAVIDLCPLYRLGEEGGEPLQLAACRISILWIVVDGKLPLQEDSIEGGDCSGFRGSLVRGWHHQSRRRNNLRKSGKYRRKNQRGHFAPSVPQGVQPRETNLSSFMLGLETWWFWHDYMWQMPLMIIQRHLVLKISLATL